MVFLKNEFSSIVLPSKIYCLIKSKKNIIYIGPKSSDLYYLIKKHKNDSFQIDVNDDDAVKNILKKIILINNCENNCILLHIRELKKLKLHHHYDKLIQMKNNIKFKKFNCNEVLNDFVY